MAAIIIAPILMEATCAVATLDTKYLQTIGPVLVSTQKITCMCFLVCKSTDRDECALGMSGCNQICTNTNGSYVCSCYLGYQISPSNPTCVGEPLCTENNIKWMAYLLYVYMALHCHTHTSPHQVYLHTLLIIMPNVSPY